LNEKPCEQAAAVVLDQYFDQWLAARLQGVKGFEQSALVELLRSADVHAYFRHCFPPEQISGELNYRCAWVRHGIGPILRTFLPWLECSGTMIQWSPSTQTNAAWADQVLVEAGQLSVLRRFAHGERYGLVRCQFESEGHISIHVVGSGEEALDRYDQSWMVAQVFDQQAKHMDHLAGQMKGWARDRLDQYSWIHKDHFIGYDLDQELLDLYQEQAKVTMLKSVEAGAFPDEVKIGPRTFGQWKRIAIATAARAGLHVSFASRLLSRHRDRLDIRNLLTVPIGYEDLKEIWCEKAGVETEQEQHELADMLMLSSVHAEEYFSNCDVPLPYGIRLGQDVALLLQFGYLANPAAFLVTELRRRYRKDWDRAVNLREAGFQRDLHALLPAPSYVPGRGNVKVRNATGGLETDIDAVLFDRSCGVLYLFQLKWLDVFGHGLKERQSKLTNLLKANSWVEQVERWVSSMPRSKLASLVGLGEELRALADFTVRTVVLTRFNARFSGTHCYDERAVWMSWPQLCRSVAEARDCPSPLNVAWHGARAIGVRPECKDAEQLTSYDFPKLRIDLYTIR
jgi:hypothetical protein